MKNEILHDANLEEKLALAESLLAKLQEASNIQEKLEILNREPIVEAFLDKPSSLQVFLAGLTPECDLAIKSILAIGQGPVLFSQIDEAEQKFESLRVLLQTLLEVEKFYDTIGGIIGYYHCIIKLILEKNHPQVNQEGEIDYSKPYGINISNENSETDSFIRWGLENFEMMSELYPVGGAGDRLNLKDESTGDPLPAAQLPYAGHTLLEGLIRDLQAKEYLVWKLGKKQVVTPVAMMTSHEKNNHENIQALCNQYGWFGRSVDSFRFFIQPLVPVITEEGNFSLSAPLKLTLKPGGHGVIWKLAVNNGIFDWFASQDRSKVLLRQINNPVAGTDGGILAFIGIGSKKMKAFGFASCQRLLNASEGMIVLVKENIRDGFRYHVANIEYTDFKSKGIEDTSTEPGGKYSIFPANTNILFGDLAAIKIALRNCSIPGKMINMKNKVPSMDAQGHLREIHGGRLESMMQNISDCIVNEYRSQISEKDHEKLKTYVTYNERRKTISVTKNEYIPGKSPLETPEACFYDQLQNFRDLLTNHCQFSCPELPALEEHVQEGPSFIGRYHPALGPLFSIISQKIKKGAIKNGSEIILEIAELDIQNLELDGSLRILAESPLGHHDESGIILYSNRCCKCELKNVKVKNHGIDWKARNRYCRNEIARFESLDIHLHGNAEFSAENVEFDGGQLIEVPTGHRMEASMKDGKIEYTIRKISEPSWHWEYRFDSNDKIVLKKINGSPIKQ